MTWFEGFPPILSLFGPKGFLGVFSSSFLGTSCTILGSRVSFGGNIFTFPGGAGLTGAGLTGDLVTWLEGFPPYFITFLAQEVFGGGFFVIFGDFLLYFGIQGGLWFCFTFFTKF